MTCSHGFLHDVTVGPGRQSLERRLGRTRGIAEARKARAKSCANALCAHHRSATLSSWKPRAYQKKLIILTVDGQNFASPKVSDGHERKHNKWQPDTPTPSGFKRGNGGGLTTSNDMTWTNSNVRKQKREQSGAIFCPSTVSHGEVLHPLKMVCTACVLRSHIHVTVASQSPHNHLTFTSQSRHGETQTKT